MRKLFIFVFLCPLFSKAQKLVPRFENDTLYTTCGYKIYPGQVLHFAKGTARDKRFAYVRFIGVCCEEVNLLNNSVTVIKLSKYNISGLGNAYIRVRGWMVFPKGDRLKIDFNMAFDEAIKETATRSPELIVPDEFRNKQEQSTSDELSKLYKLYQDSIITKEEYEIQKSKLPKQ